MTNGIVAFLTDFADRDGFTGVLKGVVLSIYREAILADVAHDVPPQNIWHASWILNQVFDAYPAGSFFVCVVDPGVGNPNQKKLALYSETLRKGVILPDNGLATRLLKRIPDLRCVSLENKFYYWNQHPSHTFHGRDIYAPTAAHLAKAFAENRTKQCFADLGPSLLTDDLVQLDIPMASKLSGGRVEGQIDVADIFGNLITNIPLKWLDTAQRHYKITDAHMESIPAVLVAHYSAAEQIVGCNRGTLILVPGSHGMLEISLPRGSAQDVLPLHTGSALFLQPCD